MQHLTALSTAISAIEPTSLPPWLPVSVLIWAIQQVAYYGFSFAFEACDRAGAGRPIKARAADRKSFAQMVPTVLSNQVLVLLPSMMLAQWAGLCFTGPARLSLGRFVLNMPAMAALHDVFQYLTHRHLLHNPSIRLMRALRHSVHHTTTASRGISACYMSAPDFFLEIVLPYLVPLAIVGGGGTDLMFHGIVASMGALGGIYEHSGYDLALLFETATQGVNKAAVAKNADGLEASSRAPSSSSSSSLVPLLQWVPPSLLRAVAGVVTSKSHGEHHSRGNVSFSDGFGSPGICDTLFGTRWDIVAAWLAAEREWKAQHAQLAQLNAKNEAGAEKKESREMNVMTGKVAAAAA